MMSQVICHKTKFSQCNFLISFISYNLLWISIQRWKSSSEWNVLCLSTMALTMGNVPCFRKKDWHCLSIGTGPLQVSRPCMDASKSIWWRISSTNNMFNLECLYWTSRGIIFNGHPRDGDFNNLSFVSKPQLINFM